MAIDKETRDRLTTIFLPPHSTFVEGADDDNPSDEDDIAYNEKCNEEIKKNLNHFAAVAQADYERAVAEREAILAAVPEGEPVPARHRAAIPEPGAPMARTRYPGDDEGSEDVVSLDRDGEIVVLDTGTR